MRDLTPVLENAEVKKLREDTALWEARLSSLVITSQTDYMAMGEYYRAIKEAESQVETQEKLFTAPLNTALKNIRVFFNPLLDRLVTLRKKAKSEMGIWEAKLEADRIKKQRELDEAAARERLKLEAKAVKAEDKGNEQKAELFRQQAEGVTPAVATTAPKVNGVRFRKIWKIKIVNAALVPREHCMPDEVGIRKLANDLKGEIEIPGVEIWSEMV